MDINKIALALISRISFRGQHCCIICGHRVGRFIPYKDGKQAPSLPVALGIIGSDTFNFECPWCGAHDRERHLLMYMNATGLFDELPSKSLLHFAPERRLSKLIAAKEPVIYIKCDLAPQESDVKEVDILAIPYKNKTFDLVIANHVLEHVSDDIQALREIFRVLKPGGHAILQTPYCLKLHSTWSDEGIDNSHARLMAYGQEDHVRLFGRDIFVRIQSVGLTPQVHHHKELLSRFDPIQYGVNAAEPYFLFKRNSEPAK